MQRTRQETRRGSQRDQAGRRWFGIAVAWAPLVALAAWVAFSRAAEKNEQPPSRASAINSGDRAAQTAGGKNWPIFRGDALASGVSRTTLPDKPELLWKVDLKEGPIESTAAIVDGVVYVACLDGGVHARDLATGEKQWSFPSEIGFNASPAVKDALVYIGDAEGTFFCLDAATGKPKWRHVAEAPIDNSANFYKENVLVGSQDATLYCLNAKTGKLVWKYQAEDQIRCAPTVVENRAFLAGCDGKLHVVNLDRGEAVDTVDIDGPTGTTPAASGSNVFFGTEAGIFYGIDWKAAKVNWRFRDPRSELPLRSSAAVTPEMLIFGGRSKRVYGLDPKSGRRVWVAATGGRVDSSPVVVGRRAFIGASDGRLYALDVGSGKKLWEFEAGGEITASPAVAAGKLVIGNDAGVLFCFGKK